VLVLKILVLGNGFDLAHKLPTKYTDFLHFTRVVLELLNGDFSNVNWEGINPKLKKVIIENTGNKRNNLYSQKDIWLDLIDNNFWFTHFQNCYINDGWIDFESEISKVIQQIEADLINGLNLYFSIGPNIETEDIEVKYVKEIILKLENTRSCYPDKLTDDACDKLYKDLNKLIRALELYLVDYVGNIEVDVVSPDIKGINPSKVLSFNYTDTYNKVYMPINSVQYDFIHGKASSTSTLETNNMVLGVDEYLPNDRKDKDVKFVAYKKYYQRIFKSTGSLYKDWVEVLQGPTYKDGKGDVILIPDNHEVYIFGHSLDVTDKDVLRDLILSPYAETTIYYLDNVDYGKKITNLVKVIGPDELVKRTGGPTKSITFKQQSPMENKA
jgi:hypothetical protein